MNYTIKEVHVIYVAGILTEVSVMWISNEKQNWVRATYINNKPVGGYGFIKAKAQLNEELLQEAAGYGASLPEEKRKKYFPGKHKWER